MRLLKDEKWFSNINLFGNPGMVLSNNDNTHFLIFFFYGVFTLGGKQCKDLLYIITVILIAPP